ncbi:hypothetical protein HAPAU_03320 [Halalkalicoccus paucihalophilus]|uniref:Uncharacterized protein n=1 Tax=Halalkalicoccus paucihalophilus TaxID=1008153 RepID=A0A151AJ78_9EURY|nr:DUF5797 family protein [Halalkalicoccus paucihalophilus]KYH27664.1 hypothetical protein HAPAU_03320 [Halalkalicoccus paucihalophilus]
MTLSEEATERLADVVSLQPTKNAELQDRWGMESGSEVHQYLENELSEYYYRDEDSLIRATPDAADLVDVDPGIEGGADGTVIRVPELQGQVFEVLAGPDERSQSVVSVLQDLRSEFGIDPEAGDVRSALQSLKRKGIVEVEYRTVPTFRKAAPREDVTVETLE